ncbi:MAG TPA: histone deacetylase [Desulfomonilia bacterium]
MKTGRIKAKNRTGLIFFPAYDWEISAFHPERKERLLYTHDQVIEEGLLDIEGISEFKAGIATDKDISRVHFCLPDIDSVITDSHRISAGGCIEAARLVLEKKVDRSFALVRPPGHHSMRVVHGCRGFCNINMEAIMVEWIRTNYPHIKKIVIVDTDCHHGDGTQDIFWHDPDILFISVHQDGRTLYPWSGFPEDLGGSGARGMTLNVPLPPGTTDDGFIYVAENLIRPILDEFKPDIVINSAGQDNHYSDPITDMQFTAGGYARLTEIVSPDICVLEGGYSIEMALPYINTGIILSLAGVDYSYLKEPDFRPDRFKQASVEMKYIAGLCDSMLNYWRKRQGIPLKKEGIVERRKTVRYDTDNIVDRQAEFKKMCDCPGVFRIETRASTGNSATCVHIPRGACESCRSQGIEWFDSAEGFDFVQMQDMDKDIFTSRKG